MDLQSFDLSENEHRQSNHFPAPTRRGKTDARKLKRAGMLQVLCTSPHPTRCVPIEKLGNPTPCTTVVLKTNRNNSRKVYYYEKYANIKLQIPHQQVNTRSSKSNSVKQSDCLQKCHFQRLTN